MNKTKICALISNMNEIKTLCEIANNASPSAKAEVVGRCSGRTLDDILNAIWDMAHDTKANLMATTKES